MFVCVCHVTVCVMFVCVSVLSEVCLVKIACKVTNVVKTWTMFVQVL